MDPAEQSAGIRDEERNLISVLYHALHGAETIEAYLLDAEAAGDERLAGFFREAWTMHRQLAGRAKELLGIPDAPSGSGAVPEGGVELGDISGGMPQGDAGGIPPGDISGGIPPR